MPGFFFMEFRNYFAQRGWHYTLMGVYYTQEMKITKGGTQNEDGRNQDGKHR